ncbi:hypothetical protein B0H16DRAFT_1538506 [Mycena metata]|uniref:BTB domain-containing protein n=1 Tax=Mycena metata TaxID=1033252 RepID=A0AAD7J494_9AGAR|nr:hypothetical protein B0H16DRAFT_1538506 [Mycena metata]
MDPAVNDPQTSPLPSTPFRDPQADLTLRSSDDIDFLVHRNILSTASPFFEGMFTLPQAEPTETERPIVRMAESGEVLNRILQFWYPGGEPVVENLHQLGEILDIAIIKYDLQPAIYLGQQFLRDYVERDPVGSFSIAVSHGWDEMALTAARETLKRPLRAFSDEASRELSHITGAAYYSLLRYHFQCGEVAGRIGTDSEWNSGSHLWRLISHDKKCICIRDTDSSGEPQIWFRDLLRGMGEKFSTIPRRTHF